MDTGVLIQIAQLILCLSILVVLHELGHFIPAKLFKTKVEKFYLFFDPWFSLFKKKIGETEYGIGWLPLGGYVKIAGMMDESMDKEQLKEPAKAWEFRAKPAWQRLIIMAGGVTVNMILAFVIYTCIVLVWGTESYSSADAKYGIGVSSTMKKLGFRDNDQILKIDGKEATDISDLNKSLLVRDLKSIEVKHSDGTIQTIAIPDTIGQTIFQEGTVSSFEPRYAFVVDSIIAESPAAKAGLKKMDKIIAVNSDSVRYYNEFSNLILNKNEKQVELTIENNGAVRKTKVTLDKNGKLGFIAKPIDKNYLTTHHHNYGFFESIKEGVIIGYNTLHDYITQFKYVFTKKGSSQIGGFGTMTKLFASEWNWLLFWERTAMISVMLAFMNLLPIPALDGGHIVFTLWEMITGKKPSDKFLEYAQIVGFILVLSLLLYANGNDIYRWINS